MRSPLAPLGVERSRQTDARNARKAGAAQCPVSAPAPRHLNGSFQWSVVHKPSPDDSSQRPSTTTGTPDRAASPYASEATGALPVNSSMSPSIQVAERIGGHEKGPGEARCSGDRCRPRAGSDRVDCERCGSRRDVETADGSRNPSGRSGTVVLSLAWYLEVEMSRRFAMEGARTLCTRAEQPSFLGASGL
jgi:hypothetical protein